MNKFADWLFSEEWLMDITALIGRYEALMMVGYITVALLLAFGLLYLHDLLRGRI